MKIYNTRALTKNQRFQNALLVAIPTTIGMAVILGLVLRVMPIQFEIMFLAVGYGMGYVIRTYGRGVQKRFSILGAICTFITILLADAIHMVGITGLFNPLIWLLALTSYFTSLGSLWGMLGLLFRVGAISVAYEQSRIV